MTLETADPVPRATPLGLFLGFATIGVIGFGGVMPWVRWLLVEKRRWCSEEEFVNLFALANFLPGGNVVSIAVMIGARLGGFPGSVAAVTGLVAPPAILVCVVGELYRRYSDMPAVERMLDAMAAAAAGLIVAMGLRMFWPMRRNPRAVVVILVVLGLAAVLRLPLVWILATVFPASLLAARLTRL